MSIINWLRSSDIIFFQYMHIDWAERETSVDTRILEKGQDTKVLKARMFDQNEFWDGYENFDIAGFYTEGQSIDFTGSDPFYIAEREESENFLDSAWLNKVDKIRDIITDIIADPWKLKSAITIHFWWENQGEGQWENIYTIYPMSYS